MSTKIFTKGRRYRAKLTFESCGYRFEKGEVLVFKGEAIIPYDDTYSFRFTSRDGSEKFWLVRADQLMKVWNLHFKKVGIFGW